MGEVRFVEYDEEFLTLSWEWLNDPEIKYLTNTPNFTKEGQKAWFKKLKNKANYKIWGIKYNNSKIGVVGLKNMEEDKAEYFGFIGNKTFWNKGLSRIMLDHIRNYANQNDISNIWLRVIKQNPQAIKAYQKYGFEVYEENDNELLMRFNNI